MGILSSSLTVSGDGICVKTGASSEAETLVNAIKTAFTTVTALTSFESPMPLGLEQS